MVVCELPVVPAVNETAISHNDGRQDNNFHSLVSGQRNSPRTSLWQNACCKHSSTCVEKSNRALSSAVCQDVRKAQGCALSRKFNDNMGF
mmetsp:Transcript_17559/g.47868  ORF Transcript_17559/g.47868 Transcript_17559/m.47868 type:complete len:90 (-) Transcript_17559:232-501(-)